jgi:hypothetical protein
MAVVVLLLIAAVAGGYVLVRRVRDPYRTIPPLAVADYLENSNSLRGNTYKLTGTISQALTWSPTRGRLFSVEVASPGGADILPVLVPTEFNSVNIQRGQRFQFKLEVDELGILRVRALEKT